MHTHNDLWLWLMYSMGQGIHVLLQLDALVRSPNNPQGSRREALKRNGPRLAGRVFAATLLFMLIWDNPGALGWALDKAGWTSAPEWVRNILSVTPMPAWVAGALGLVSDTLLSFIPKLKNIVPEPGD